ncbi:molybdate ABC transporter substrate-binding protein [Pseudomonas sp. gcc21]|uniref:molybdate ABC transporter substrate-binding protein n=1 Tax=Pseudomonas sp. gcc21 TaxID=2726989 RepID=UPI001452190E|nr:molybdate ABC transporter substrate-binding protein [Pseudomonas sp. gcc21]QJD58753.1 molybdate ABC transporter substrate-binding protein [Pseudomonas sp. gcc21]
MTLSRLFGRVVLAWCLGYPLVTTADQPLTLAAASDLRFALEEIIQAWDAQYPQQEVRVIYGSSGRFATQIRQGAPFDLYLSADATYALALHQDGFTAGPPQPYAIGRIVLWSKDSRLAEKGLEGLAVSPPKRLAIARPSHAPYGARAQEALQAIGAWTTVEPHLVYGENISGTAQMAESGAAEAAIIALSLALHPGMQRQGHYQLIDDRLHAPLLQAMVVTRRAADNANAERLARFIRAPAAQKILEKYGFAAPPESLALPAP